MPDNSVVRYYVDTDTGLETLNAEDVVKVFQGSEENKKFLSSQMDRFTINAIVKPPETKPKEKKIKLSDFNQKLKIASNFNPNPNKK